MTALAMVEESLECSFCTADAVASKRSNDGVFPQTRHGQAIYLIVNETDKQEKTASFGLFARSENHR